MMEMQPGQAPAIQDIDEDQGDPRLHSMFTPSIGDIGEPAPVQHTPSIQAPVQPTIQHEPTMQEKINPMSGIFAKADNIHNPFLRAMAKISSGVAAVGLGGAEGASGVAKDRHDMLLAQQENARQNAQTRASIEKSQRDKYDLKTGVNPTTGDEEHFYIGNDGKPIFTGVKVKAKEPKVGLTGEEGLIHDLMTGDGGKARINPDTQQPFTYEEAYIRSKQDAQDTKPDKTPKVSYQTDNETGNVVALTQHPDGSITSGVVYHGSPRLKTAIKTESQPDGSVHDVLYDTQTGATIKTLGLSANSPQPDTADYSLHGEEFLNSLNPGDQATVKAIGEGRMELTASLLRSKEGQKLAKQVNQAYPGWDQSRAKSYFDTRTSFEKGDIGKGINHLNTAVEHLGKLYDSATFSAVAPGASFLSRHVVQPFSSENTNATNFKVYREKVLEEVQHAYDNKALTDQDKKDLDHQIRGWTPNTARADIRATAVLLNSKLHAYQSQWDNAKPSGAVSDFPVINERASKVLQRLAPGEKPTTISPAQSRKTLAPNGFDISKFPKAN